MTVGLIFGKLGLRRPVEIPGHQAEYAARPLWRVLLFLGFGFSHRRLTERTRRLFAPQSHTLIQFVIRLKRYMWRPSWSVFRRPQRPAVVMLRRTEQGAEWTIAVKLERNQGAGRRFADEWKDAHYEKGETQSFYNDFFEVFGVKRRRVASFEEPVKQLVGSKRGFIDLFWKGVLLCRAEERWP